MRLEAGDSGWPAVLSELADPPSSVSVSGAWPLEGPAIAIVGARRASEAGLRFARRLARGLAEEGVIVVSGGALGVDAAAHEGALDGGGRTLVVLPTGLDAPYPARNRKLFGRVLDAGGTWLSEEEGGGPVGKASFLRRNRIVAALAGALVVVEASVRSGTRHTLGHARRLGRPVGAVPWDPGHPLGAGCIEALRGGGSVVAGPADALALIGLRPRSRRARPAPAAPLDPFSKKLLDRIARGPAAPDALAAELSRPLSTVLGALTTLELQGLVAPRPGGRYARA